MNNTITKTKNHYYKPLPRLLKPIKWALDMLLPPTCLACGANVVAKDFSGSLCAYCWGELHVLSDCDAAVDAFLKEVAFDKILAPFFYDSTAATLVKKLKYNGRTATANFMAQQMLPFIQHENVDIIVPVPLHKKRLYHRYYNQAAELGRRLSDDSGLPWDGVGLQRVIATQSQVGQNADRRRKQLRHAFVADNRFLGQRVLLVDDVCTTGSTAHWCSQALLQAGAKKVELLTFAFVEPKV